MQVIPCCKPNSGSFAESKQSIHPNCDQGKNQEIGFVLQRNVILDQHNLRFVNKTGNKFYYIFTTIC